MSFKTFAQKFLKPLHSSRVFWGHAWGLGHVVREEGQGTTGQPGLLLCTEVSSVAGSDGPSRWLPPQWLLAHFSRTAVHKLYTQDSLLLDLGFVCCLGFFFPKLWNGWLPHSLTQISEITDCLFHKASRANRTASAGAVLQARGKEKKSGGRWTEAGWNFPLCLRNYLLLLYPGGPTQFENCFWPQLNYISTDFFPQGSPNYVHDTMK